MSAGQQPDEQPVDQRPLADEDAANLGVQRVEPLPRLFDEPGLRGEVGGHGPPAGIRGGRQVRHLSSEQRGPLGAMPTLA
ncbi:MAG: hypothetical protein U0736_23570 [Gemmataceae bacterium]